MTNIHTAHTTYKVDCVHPGRIGVRQPSGKLRYLTVAEVGRARFDAAVADYLAKLHRVVS